MDGSLLRVLAPAALVAALLAGCNSKGGTSIEDTNAPDQTGEAASPDGRVDRAHRKAFHGGPEKMLRDALAELDLSADQKATIDKALADARPEGAPGEAMKPVFALVASQVRAGAIDERAVDAKLAELGGSRDAWKAKAAAALQTVHDTLTSEQRAELVSNLESRMSDLQARDADGDHQRGERRHDHARGDHMRGDRMPGDHMRADRKHGEQMHGKLGFLLRGLDIDDAQREKIESAIEARGIQGPDRATMQAKRAEMKEKFHGMIEAF
jgi:Spy/CpxP family protein refolding chaperone